ncbi:hypothetical protein GQX73_g1102 [Xylaria multiplex]|uniref:Uncharacterized protein n=1 Tax=Xylaria multiplex TaxID=323545 RepID=A0A7C8MY78_9PEZI|nr:hypothetical protein GQX73_g1102 [Xylaria multiplex]
MSHIQQSGPPYASRTAGLGGVPEVIPDIPICAVFLTLYLSSAITNMTILQINLRRQHKFVISGALFGFSMSRIITFILRIVWALNQHNVRLAIAANVFVNAGVLVVYVINLIFAQRILRSKQPALGWHPAISIALKVFYVGIAAALVLVIYSVVQGSYTLNPNTLRAVRNIQLAATTYLLVFTTLPIWLLMIAHLLLPKSADEELFGHGSMRTKVLINMLSTCVCITIAGFKVGTAWETPRPLSNPAWYHSKPAFYVFSFVLEIFVLALLTLSRVDKRFHIPNGSKRPGDYSRGQSEQTTMEKGESSDHSGDS